MLRKVFNQPYFFGFAFIVTLCLLALQPEHHTPAKHGETVIATETSFVHSSPPLHQPFEIEDKEEQPETEDDESNEGGPANLASASGYLVPLCKLPSSFSKLVISKSRTEYHTPGYVRLRSILI